MRIITEHENTKKSSFEKKQVGDIWSKGEPDKFELKVDKREAASSGR